MSYHRDEIMTACKQALGKEAHEVLAIAQKLRKLQTLLEGPLYIKRIAGLLASTEKPDPMDCKYVRLALAEWVESPENFLILKDLLNDLLEDL